MNSFLWIRNRKNASPCSVVRVTAYKPAVRFTYTWWQVEAQLPPDIFTKMFRPYNAFDNNDRSLICNLTTR